MAEGDQQDSGGGPMDRLKQEAKDFATAQAERLLTAVGRKVGSTTAKLTGLPTGGDGSGLPGMAKQAGQKLAEGKGPARAVVEGGASDLKDRAKGAVGLGGGGKDGGDDGGKGGGDDQKCVSVVEDIKVGVPLRVAYDQWTQFQEFSTFTRGVQEVDVDDEDPTSSTWRVKVLWSDRTWEAQTTEQIPDERIAWTSEGDKGTTKGVVTFHELTPNLTQILLVLEYYPSGFVEKTGNLWRAQGRRARLDLKAFRRFVMMRAEATGGWRGEIRDGEVVRDHDTVVADERRDDEHDGGREDADGDDRAARGGGEHDEDDDFEESDVDDEGENEGEGENEDEDENEDEPDDRDGDDREDGDDWDDEEWDDEEWEDEDGADRGGRGSQGGGGRGDWDDEDFEGGDFDDEDLDEEE